RRRCGTRRSPPGAPGPRPGEAAAARRCGSGGLALVLRPRQRAPAFPWTGYITADHRGSPAMTRPLIPKRLTGAASMPSNVDVIAEYEILGRHADGQLHWHDFHKVVYISGGSGVHLMNGVPHAIRPGIAFLLAPSDFHAWLPGDDGCILYNILFSPRILSPYLDAALFDAAGLGQGALVASDMSPLETIMQAMVRESGQITRPDAL